MEIDRAIAALRGAKGNSILDQMRAVDLDPRTDFKGGDWRQCDFRELDLEGFDFESCRLFGAKFKGAKVKGAKFRGASEVHRAGLHLAKDWREADLDDDQREALGLAEKIGGDSSGDSTAILATADRQGLELTEREYLRLIKQAQNFADGRNILDHKHKSKAGVTIAGFVTLFPKCKDASQAKLLFKELCDANVGITFESLTAYAVHLTDFEDLTQVINFMHERSLLGGAHLYNMALKLSPDTHSSMELVAEMVELGIDPDAYTLHELCSDSRSFEFCRELIAQWIDKGFQVTKVNLNELLFKSQTIEQKQEAIDLFETCSLEFDEFTYCGLMRREEKFDACVGIFETMIGQGLSPTKLSVSQLIRKSPTFNQACDALVLGKKNGLNIFLWDLIALLPATTGDPVYAKKELFRKQESLATPEEALRGLINYYVKIPKTANDVFDDLGMPRNGRM